MTDRELIRAAIAVRDNAYAPYSKFKVGAAILTSSGEVFRGCNVENSSFGLSICAERHAIGNMVAAGQMDIKKISVAASPIASPCGACRQFIVEFGAEIEILCADPSQPEEIKRWKITELLPDHFRFLP